ncbi:unnamed protein product [Echinostoma caproni]|uniref:BHLH domain-containing protein n=1 Tax=Echinostoma caproni TaxID=27848 RepID=A0A183B8V4_9TREM|nr:unnamed protein product [Echinostoma caproni]
MAVGRVRRGHMPTGLIGSLIRVPDNLSHGSASDVIIVMAFNALHRQYACPTITGTVHIHPKPTLTKSSNCLPMAPCSVQTSMNCMREVDPTVPDRPTRRLRVPPEQREQLRRLKKQDMERRRRACISDKMNALHIMAMRVIGVEPTVQHKLEKADILGTCYAVLEGIAKLADDDSALRSRLHSLRSRIQENYVSRNISSPDDTTRSSTLSEDPLLPDDLQMDKENQTTAHVYAAHCHSQNTMTPTDLRWSSLTSTPLASIPPGTGSVKQTLSESSHSDSGFHSSPDTSTLPRITNRPFRSPLTPLSIGSQHKNTPNYDNCGTQSVHNMSAFTPIRPKQQTASAHVWRPYLD